MWKLSGLRSALYTLRTSISLGLHSAGLHVKMQVQLDLSELRTAPMLFQSSCFFFNFLYFETSSYLQILAPCSAELECCLLAHTVTVYMNMRSLIEGNLSWAEIRCGQFNTHRTGLEGKGAIRSLHCHTNVAWRHPNHGSYAANPLLAGLLVLAPPS